MMLPCLPTRCDSRDCSMFHVSCFMFYTCTCVVCTISYHIVYTHTYIFEYGVYILDAYHFHSYIPASINFLQIERGVVSWSLSWSRGGEKKGRMTFTLLFHFALFNEWMKPSTAERTVEKKKNLLVLEVENNNSGVSPSSLPLLCNQPRVMRPHTQTFIYFV